jgi:hypothetical protein
LVVLAFGILLISYAAWIMWGAIRYRARGDVTVAITHSGLRALAGLSALWLYFGGGALAGGLLVGVLIGDLVWREFLSRRHSS